MYTYIDIFFSEICNISVLQADQKGRCRFAHSAVERDVWLVERDTDLSRESLVFQFYRCKEEALRREGHHADDVSNSSRGLLFKTFTT